MVDLGLERFVSGPDDDSKRVAILERLVKAGYTTLVREVFADSRLPASKRYAEARVLEVAPGATRWLGAAAAKPILKAAGSALRRTGYDSYSWDELERMGADNIQDLALTLDGETKVLSFSPRVELAPELKLKLIDLSLSIKNWPASSNAHKLHTLATKHRLIVHSA